MAEPGYERGCINRLYYACFYAAASSSPTPATMPNHQTLRALTAEHFRWAAWEALLEAHGVTIDRPDGTVHPDFPEITYPMNYGFVNETLASDGHEVDVFVGTAGSGLVGMILCADHRRGDREVKLLYDCTPREVYLAHGFINFDRTLLSGVLALRRPLRTLWNAEQRRR